MKDEKTVIDIPGTAKSLGVSHGFVLGILNRLTASMEEYLMPITYYAKKRDYTSLANAAHRLHGAASYLNLEVLKKRAMDIEMSAKSHINTDYRKMIDKLYMAFDLISRSNNSCPD